MRDRLAPLAQASRLDDLMRLAVRTAEELSFAGSGFLVLADPLTQQLDATAAWTAQGTSPRSAVLEEALAGAGVWPRLAHGVHVFQPARTASRDGEALGREHGFLLMPLVLDSKLQGALVLDLPSGGAALTRTIDALHELCQQVAPLLARLREIEELRQMVGGLTVLVHEGAQYEKRWQELQTEKEGARAIDAMRDQLTAGVNHALRTPLVAIRGYTRLLLEAGRSRFSPTERQYLEVIARNSDRLVDAARNLWWPARVSLRLSRLDLREVWTRVLEENRPRAAAKKVGLAQRLSASTVPIMGDAGRLERMLSEMLAGAIGLGLPGQEIRTELSDDERQVTVSVSVPVEAENGASSVDDTSSGVWLWLDSVREAANVHGGRVSALREAGQGLRLTIVLPRPHET